jgi:hypothetical protein
MGAQGGCPNYNGTVRRGIKRMIGKHTESGHCPQAIKCASRWRTALKWP